jgi:hypothetical protein
MRGISVQPSARRTSLVAAERRGWGEDRAHDPVIDAVRSDELFQQSHRVVDRAAYGFDCDCTADA